MVLLWLGCGLAGQAQLGAYGLFSATGFTGIQCLSLAPTPCSNGVAGTTFTNGVPTGKISTGNLNPTGLSGGVFYDFKTFGPVRLGVDVRGGNDHANKSASTSAGGDGITRGNYGMAGVRGSFHTPISWIKPYAQVSVGYLHSDVTESQSAYDGFLMYEGFVGADVRILPMLDLRAIELGIGNMNRIGTGGTGSTSAGVRSIGVGVVFHLPTQ
jgi:hypothetical protein